MNRKWRAPLLGGVLWLLSIVGAMLVERAHWGTEHTGMLLVGFASGLFTGNLFSAVIPREWPASPWLTITLLLIYSVGGIQRSLAAHTDLYLILSAGFVGAAFGMVLTLWYLALIPQAVKEENAGLRSPDDPQGRR